MIFRLRDSFCLSAVCTWYATTLWIFSCSPLSRVLHVTVANHQKFGFEFHLRSSSSAFSGTVWMISRINWLLHYLLNRAGEIKEGRNSCPRRLQFIDFQFGLYHVVIPLSFLRSSSLASLFFGCKYCCMLLVSGELFSNEFRVSLLGWRNLKTKVSPGKRIKCFPSTLRRRNLNTQQSPAILDLCLRNTRSGKLRDYRDVIVLEKLRFRIVFRSHGNCLKAGVFKSSGLKNLFEKLRFRDTMFTHSYSWLIWPLCRVTLPGPSNVLTVSAALYWKRHYCQRFYDLNPLWVRVRWPNGLASSFTSTRKS